MGDVAGEVCQQIAAARGDRAALGVLLESYRPYLDLLARVKIGRRLGRKADPADVVQEAVRRRLAPLLPAVRHPAGQP